MLDELTKIPKLGVGLAYQPALRPFLESRGDTFDYLEVVPDILWTDLGVGKTPRYLDDSGGIDYLRRVAGGRPVVPHGIGLSIGTAHRFNRGQLDQMEKWHGWFQFPWHSDHLAWNLAEHGVDELNAGVTLPLPRDRETLEALAPRVAEVRRRLPVPFLLENNVYFFSMPGEEMSDAEFLNTLCAETGCGLLLDLHNVYCNARNHKTDPYRLLSELDLSNVVEIHVAGGMEHEGWYLDAHSGPLPEPVWELLRYCLPRCPNLGGVTFEMFGSWFVEMGTERLAQELSALREAWHRWQPVPVHFAEVAA
ncbi:MAG TPA: DUF692 family protein [Thermoanaerobaculia bacterium]|jgi:uncharacterized protein (UPF0276 family)|nr:DUF692 family protein [Thermoanaerobaculia bacterium]